MRSRLHDSVLRSLCRSLPPGDSLRVWLTAQVPSEQDIELGYAFVQAADDVCVSRYVDTRLLPQEIQQRFEMAVRMADSTGEPEREDVDRCLARLRTMQVYCDEGRPPLEFSDWREVAPPHDMSLSWPDST